MLSRKQVNEIKRTVRQKRLKSFVLENEVIDFLSCAVEEHMAGGATFQEALAKASTAMNTAELERVQKSTVTLRKPNTIDMLQNYLKIAWRNFFKYRVNTTINVFGLVLGLSTSIVIGLYLKHEFSHDNMYPDLDRLYRVNSISYMGQTPNHLAAVSPLLRDVMLNEIPEIVQASNLDYPFYNRPLKWGESTFFDYRLGSVHVDFFEMFGIELLQGKVEDLFNQPKGVFLSASQANSIFGNQNPVGELISIVASDGEKELEVRGVYEDLPANAHFEVDQYSDFDLLISKATDILLTDNDGSWGSINNAAYIKLTADADEQVVIDKLNAILKANMDNEPWYEHYIQPMRDLHLNQRGYEIDSTGDLDQLYLFSVIAILILLIACINYVNLTTAQASVRLKEVGIRKVIGARRRQFVFQFLTEATLISIFSMLLSLALVLIVVPVLNSRFSLNLELSLAQDLVTLLGFLAIVLVVSLLCGTYPGFYLSRLQPHQLLKSGEAVKSGGGLFRKVLVVLQYATSITLIVATLVITNQLRFMSNQDLGFDQEQVIYVKVGFRQPQKYGETLFNEMSRESGVVSASLTGSSLGSDNFSGNGILVGEMAKDDRQMHKVLPVDFDFRSTLGLELTDGRWFDETYGTDRKEGYIVNQAFVKHFGLEAPLGTRLARNGREGTIVGVAKDFHYRSMRYAIEPLVMHMAPRDNFGYSSIAIRLAPGDATATLQKLQATWESIVPDYPFSYIFLDQEIDKIYQADRDFASMFSVFSMLAIVVSCLGLIGLVSFSTRRRSKEIGVRKVLGATVLRILQLISVDLVKLILVGAVVAVPLGYFFMRNWLENFEYRIGVSWWVFAVALLLTVVVSWMSVSYISLKAARANPVDALRSE